MKKRQMQQWILVLAAMVLICFVFQKVDFFHAEAADSMENENLDFSGEENESEERESEEDEEDTGIILELSEEESQDNELNLSVASNDNELEIDNRSTGCDGNCNCEDRNCSHNCIICKVKKLVADLPEIEDIDDENYEQEYQKLQDIYDEYCKLTDDEKKILDTLLNDDLGSKFEDLFKYFYENVNKPVASVTIENGEIKFYYDIFKAWAAAKSGKFATVTLMKNENLEEYDETHRYLYVDEGDNITLELADNITLSGSHGSGVICVQGGTFILNGGNSTVVNKDNPVGAVLVDGGTFILRSGTVVGKGDIMKSEDKGIDISCGVQIRNGTIYIEGGEIRGDGSGTTEHNIVGLYVQGGIVNISGGYITANSNETLGGQGIYVKTNNTVSTVNISGGRVEGIGSNEEALGNGVRTGSNDDSVTVNISGGIIIGKSDNQSGRGVYMVGGVANISGGTIAGYSKNKSGGGVDVYSKASKATIYGGVIVGSGRAESYGVRASHATSYVEIKGGIITGNGSESGYGVCVIDGSSAIVAGGDITGTGKVYGYGVYVSGNESSAEIKGGTITGTSTNGCGVGVLDGGTVDIYNGEIAGDGNSSYGVNVSGSDSVVQINGGFIGTNNVYHYASYDNSNEIITVQEGSVTYSDTELAYGVKISEGSVSINAGEISASGQKDGYGVYVSENGTVTVASGTIAGTGNSGNGYGINIDSGTADISGGEFTGEGGTDGCGSMAAMDGCLNISGGVFTGEGGSKDGYGMKVEGGTVRVVHGTSTPYGGMFIGNGSESQNGYGLYVKGGDVTLCTGVYKGSTHSVYTINSDKAESFINLLEDAHTYRYTNISADAVSSAAADSIAVSDSMVVNDKWIYKDQLSKANFDTKSVTVMRIPLSIEKPTVEPKIVDYGYSDEEAPVICIEAERLIRDESKEITYQWYDSEGPILGAVEETYVPIGLSAGTHSFTCEVICDEYKLKSEEVEIEVRKKGIIATVTLKDKEYDGSARADIDNIILSEDFVAGDDVYLAYQEDKIEDYSKIEADFTGVDVGEYTLKSEDQDKFQLSGEDQNNYHLETIVETAKINPRELILTVSVNDKVYDGSCYAKLDKSKTFFIHDDIADSDHITLDIKEVKDDEDYIVQFSDKNVNEDIPIKLNKDKFQLTNNEKGNYSLILPDDVTADITPVEVGLTVVVKDEEISADKIEKSDDSATIIFADFDKEKLADCDADIIELVDFGNINAAFESVELGKHTIKFDSDFYLIDSDSGKRTDNYILIPNVMAAIYKKGTSGTETTDPEDDITSVSPEQSIKVTSVLSGLDKNPLTGINDHLLYFIIVFLVFGGIILIIHFTGGRKKAKNNSKS